MLFQFNLKNIFPNNFQSEKEIVSYSYIMHYFVKIQKLKTESAITKQQMTTFSDLARMMIQGNVKAPDKMREWFKDIPNARIIVEYRGSLAHLQKDVFKADTFNLRHFLAFEAFDGGEEYNALRRTPTPTLPQNTEESNIKTSQNIRNRIMSLRDPREKPKPKPKALNKSVMELQPSPPTIQKIATTEENSNFLFTSPLEGMSFLTEEEIKQLLHTKKHKKEEPVYNKVFEEQKFGNFKTVRTIGMEYRSADLDQVKERPSSLQVYRHAIFQSTNSRKWSNKGLSESEMRMLALSRDKNGGKDRLTKELLLFSDKNSKNFKIKAKVDLGIKFKI